MLVGCSSSASNVCGKDRTCSPSFGGKSCCSQSVQTVVSTGLHNARLHVLSNSEMARQLVLKPRHKNTHHHVYWDLYDSHDGKGLESKYEVVSHGSFAPLNMSLARCCLCVWGNCGKSQQHGCHDACGLTYVCYGCQWTAPRCMHDFRYMINCEKKSTHFNFQC